METSFLKIDFDPYLLLDCWLDLRLYVLGPICVPRHPVLYQEA